ncbi:restriction endonuclease [Allomuricauda sp. F6463D]|uniref:restriction endonuclease n=1 Tax=Allomuricauda sp. F6463D TaxID=2926409 RepID=UPI001FF2A3EB|nr:restriction endonuclease [Muricauda sp. F6463D]MCK0159638.1 restriction endonuclease [Muricauda sp. F6463D]
MTKSKEYKLHVQDYFFEILERFNPSQNLDINQGLDKYLSNKKVFLKEAEFNDALKSLKTKLRNHIKYKINKSSLSKFEFSKSDDNLIIGIAKRNPVYKETPAIVRYLLNCDDKDFELISAVLVNHLLTEYSVVTRKSADGGIDFVGKGDFSKAIDPKIDTVLSKKNNVIFRVVGQSKRYNPKSVKIKTKDIREFYGSAKILQNALDEHYLSGWLGDSKILSEIRLADPFLLVYITTTYYSSDSIALSDKLGILVFDIDDIAFEIIEHSIGLDNNEFDEVKFLREIKKRHTTKPISNSALRDATAHS